MRADTSTGALCLSRHFAAGPQRVWTAWTDPEELRRWWWPAGWDTSYDLDLRVGGRYRIATTALPQNMAVTGEYIAVDPPRRLVQTWLWEGDPAQTLVTVEFTGVAGGTDVVVLHERFDTVEERDQHSQGWADCIDRLVELLAGG